MKLHNLIGKKIVAVKSSAKSTEEYREPSFILFDDKKTILELSEQDYYDYHDCSKSARNLYMFEDKEQWQRIMDNFADANAYL